MDTSTIIAVLTALSGVVLLSWPKLKAWMPKPGLPAPPKVVVNDADLLSRLVALRRDFAGSPDAVRSLDEVIIPAAIKRLSEAKA